MESLDSSNAGAASRERDVMISAARASPLEQIPSQLDTPAGKLVYLLLFITSEAEPHAIAEVLNMKLLTVLPLLELLQEQQLVEREGSRYRCCRR